MATMPARATVVCVHGLWMTGVDMSLLRRRIRRCGFDVRQFTYPSIRADVKTNAERLQRFISTLEAGTIHLVGHSLGGLVIRQTVHELSQTADERRIGRIVTLGTPHNGSRVAQVMAARPWMRWVLGRSFYHGLDGQLPPWPVNHEPGVIAGTLNIGIGRLITSLPGVSDGTVLLEETRLEGGSDHITVPVTHTALQFSRQAAQQVCAFLRHGRFERQPVSAG